MTTVRVSTDFRRGCRDTGHRPAAGRNPVRCFCARVKKRGKDRLWNEISPKAVRRLSPNQLFSALLAKVLYVNSAFHLLATHVTGSIELLARTEFFLNAGLVILTFVALEALFNVVTFFNGYNNHTVSTALVYYSRSAGPLIYNSFSLGPVVLVCCGFSAKRVQRW